ncbi:hypothetical protein PIB30_061656 [Stylosanthes scabra]|uniref:CCHC-type domain-containing protein n=1 Tax=Stylosanthes scabra TaxID=79078 RepID=A0ABU6RL89_9FABA|nr:hypothetical protein [Stylosanthes scabra]
MTTLTTACYKKEAYQRCYEPVIHPCNGPNLWERTTFDDIMLPPFRNPSHRPTKKRRRDPTEEEGRNPTHLSRMGQVQRCSNCGVAGHKKRGCKKPPAASARPPKKSNASSSSNGKGKATMKSATGRESTSLSQPPPQTCNRKRKKTGETSSSQPLPSRVVSQPSPNPTWPDRTRRAVASTSTSQKPPAQPNIRSKSRGTNKSSKRPNAISSSQPIKKSSKATVKPSSRPSSSQPIGNRPRFYVRHVSGGPHISPKKLRQMAKLPPRAWGNI